MSTSSVQNFFYQAADAVKEMLGLDTPLPKSREPLDKSYLDDIKQGKWRNSLNATSPNETYLPVVGFPPDYNWSLKNHSFTTNFDRRPFLNQIRSQSLSSLRHVQTKDRSSFIPDKDFKLQSSKSNRPQLFSDIRNFKMSQLNHIDASKLEPSMFTQMKDVVSSAIDSVKDALGMDTWPQSQKNHEQRYLNDIVSGTWKPLNNVATIEKKVPVVGFPANYNMYAGLKFNTNAPRLPPYLEQVRDGKKLRHIEGIVERSGYSGDPRNWQMSKLHVRDQLLLSIREFNPSALKRTEPRINGSQLLSKAKAFLSEQVDSAKEMFGINTYPQRTTEHTRPYLNDIASGNWKSLNHGGEVRESKPVISQEWKEPADRNELLGEVQKGCELKHVETVEKHSLVVDPSYSVKQMVEERKAMLDNIREFENESLHHTGSS